MICATPVRSAFRMAALITAALPSLLPAQAGGGGTLDEMRASIWVAEEYRKIGLTPLGEDGTYFQWFNIVRTRISTTASRVAIGGQSLALYLDIIPTCDMSMPRWRG